MKKKIRKVSAKAAAEAIFGGAYEAVWAYVDCQEPENKERIRKVLAPGVASNIEAVDSLLDALLWATERNVQESLSLLYNHATGNTMASGDINSLLRITEFLLYTARLGCGKWKDNPAFTPTGMAEKFERLLQHAEA